MIEKLEINPSSYTEIYIREKINELVDAYNGLVEKEPETELFPCPWCNQVPKVSLMVDAECLAGDYTVDCLNADCVCAPGTSIYETKEEAINAWNKRA